MSKKSKPAKSSPYKLEVRPTSDQGGQWALVKIYSDGQVEELLRKFSKEQAEAELEKRVKY